MPSVNGRRSRSSPSFLTLNKGDLGEALGACEYREQTQQQWLIEMLDAKKLKDAVVGRRGAKAFRQDKFVFNRLLSRRGT